ncbi:MAG: hypothetical protein GXP49_05760, partial [Deltaproteobacteria bacterium]|nr:hypothetical protein [Deltaproteobacteria bacterium]
TDTDTGSTNHPPQTSPDLLSPGNGERVRVLTPAFKLENVSDPDGDKVFYEFEVYPGRGDSTAVASSGKVKAGNAGQTLWQPDVPLPSAGSYVWKARAVDEHDAAGPWSGLFAFTIDLSKVNSDGCGCSTHAGGSGGLLVMAFIGLALLKRKR